jgi:hypothetical protein
MEAGAKEERRELRTGREEGAVARDAKLEFIRVLLVIVTIHVATRRQMADMMKGPRSDPLRAEAPEMGLSM